MASRSSLITAALLITVALAACGSGGGAATSTAVSAVSTAITSAGPASSAGPAATLEAPAESSSPATTAPDATSAEDASTAPGQPSDTASANEGTCPVTAAKLTGLTGITWTFGTHEVNQDYPFTDPPLASSACVFTANDVVDSFGQAMVLRTDDINGADNAAAVQAAFEKSCTDNSGVLASPGAGLSTCANDGVVDDGLVLTDDRVIAIYVVVGDEKIVAEKISPAFTQILASAS